MFFWSGGSGSFVFVGVLIFAPLLIAAILHALLGMGRRAGDAADEFPSWRANELPAGRRWECRRPNCRALNPPHARFCRACGARRPARRLFD